MNATAVAFYLRLGFQIVGLDTSMYAGTQAAGQTAIYLALPVEAGPEPDGVDAYAPRAALAMALGLVPIASARYHLTTGEG